MSIFAAILEIVYAHLLLVSLLNLFLVKRPRRDSEVCFQVLVPARNEATRIPNLLKALEHVKVTVLDDHSTDDTAEVAQSLGATVIPGQPLPEGWTGKCYACHQLSQIRESEWVVMMDADTLPSPDFVRKFSAFLNESEAEVVTGFPRMVPGAGLEPAYLGWVPWILLATNPFGLVSRTGKGHNRFTNGQIVAWRTSALERIRPFEAVRAEVLEDVKIGRLLAQQGVPVEVCNLSGILAVKMYETLGEAWQGMLKNSADIAPGLLGCLAFSAYFVLVGVGWAFLPTPWIGLGALLLSKGLTDRVIRYPIWTVPFIPLSCLAAAATILASYWRKRTKGVEWKGRVYS